MYLSTTYGVENIMKDSRRVFRVLEDEEEGVSRQPREEAVWGGLKKRRFPTAVLS